MSSPLQRIISRDKSNHTEKEDETKRSRVYADGNGNPSEVTIKILWGDYFMVHTKRKIEEVMAFGIVCTTFFLRFHAH